MRPEASPALFDHGQNILGVENLVFLALEIHFRAPVFGYQQAVALLHFERNLFAVVSGFPGAERDHPAFHWLFLGDVRNNDPALLFLVLFNSFNEDPVTEGSNVQCHNSPLLWAFNRQPVSCHRESRSPFLVKAVIEEMVKGCRESTIRRPPSRGCATDQRWRAIS